MKIIAHITCSCTVTASQCITADISISRIGKVVIDAFRLINPNTMVLGQEPRQTTSNLGHLQKPSIQVSNNTILILIHNIHI